MSQTNPLRVRGSEHLSVIHKSTFLADEDWLHLPDAVIQTDLQFNIIGWNPAAEKLHDLPGKMGMNLFGAVNLEFVTGSVAKLRADLATFRCWNGEVILTRPDGQKFSFRSTANYIISEKGEPVAIMIVNHNITDIKSKERQMAETEKEYATIVNTLFDGVIMVRSNGRIGACNKRAADLLGLTEEEQSGLVPISPRWKAYREDGTELPDDEFPARLTIETGLSQRHAIIMIELFDGNRRWLQVNSQALFYPGEKKAYAAVVSFSDITDKLNSEEALRKSNERFLYAGKITSDAIWDLDLETNEIYRSEAFSAFSGYNSKQVQPRLDWWFDKIHPEDKDRVRDKVNESIRKGIAHWQDEYRFLCADGNYKYLLDSWIILYRNKKPVRIIGAIQDLTERKQLEARLLQEEIQKQKQLSQASIAAQERERNNISKELHDNVNQILISAKLFMDTARRDPQQTYELLDKAIEYQVLAMEEIRKLSKSLSTGFLKAVGLRDSVQDIVTNMKKLQQIEVDFTFNNRVEEVLSDEQKLMLFRIIQEQTSNIIKYAEARSVRVLLNETAGNIHLVICDDGKGFKAKKKSKGIGFVNIISRVDAYNGKVDIMSSPGNGCTLEVQFPVNS